MSDFVKVAKTSDLPDPGKETIEVADRVIVLFHVGGKFYAIDDVCTHDDGPLGEGELDGFQIACPRHGARFDIRSGQVLSLPATRSIAAHEVRVDGDDVLVRIRDDEEN